MSESHKKNLKNEEIENEFKSRYQNMKQLYEMRFLALQESVKEAISKIFEDELLLTMKSDFTSAEYINQRIAEIFLDLVNGDREAIIEKLSYQYACLKTDYSNLVTSKSNVKID